MELPDGAVDAITCATAFHWFDGERSLAEFHRVLVPGGGLALLWNTRDESVEWVRDLHSVLAEAVSENCEPPARKKAQELLHLDWRAPFNDTDFFAPATKRLIPPRPRGRRRHAGGALPLGELHRGHARTRRGRASRPRSPSSCGRTRRRAEAR
jgi:SAM-dependent methyltransferase